MKAVIDRLKRIAPTDATVLITGESGTGKELIAQAIHQNSPRKNKRMVPLNARAVAENLVESELFGHVKGAFTDAVTDRVGAFEYANGGTLFLDEVGDMPISYSGQAAAGAGGQPDHASRRQQVRSRSMCDWSPRPIAIWKTAVESGEFRRDLYYRIKVITVELPSLRERREDIVPLMDHFRKQFAKRHRKSVKAFSPSVSRLLFAYDWPGNVRQLRNAVETMVVLDADGVLDVDDLPPELADRRGCLMPSPKTVRWGWSASRWRRSNAGPSSRRLKLTNGNREETARILGIGARTLYRKLDKYKL